MAKRETSAVEEQVPTQAPEAAEAAPERSRFQKIETERYMFNSQKCYADLPAGQRRPLVGYLVNMIPMPPIARGKDRRTGETIMQDWDAVVIKTTEPTHALDREKRVIEVPAGSEVLIPATHQIVQFLTRAASHPEFVYEVIIEPSKKVEIGNGQTMWQYHLGANPNPIPRKRLGISGLLSQGSQAPQLSAPAGTSESTDAGGDIPF